MEGSSLISFSFSSSSISPPPPHHLYSLKNLTSHSPPCFEKRSQIVNMGLSNLSTNNKQQALVGISRPRSSLRLSAFMVERELKEKSNSGDKVNKYNNMPKIDKNGRFCSPRAARELALLITYAACLEGSDPIRLFEKRVNARREPGYEFDKASLLEYNHMSFGGPPVTTETLEEADELMRTNEKESAIEADVLSAPPKLVYSKLLLRFTRKLLVAVVEKWDSHILVIDKVAPPSWKNEPAGRILELCILHLAMSEISVLGTRHQIVINEAVDLAKRFCDGAAPRIINGCLRTFINDRSAGPMVTQASDANQKVEV